MPRSSAARARSSTLESEPPNRRVRPQSVTESATRRANVWPAISGWRAPPAARRGGASPPGRAPPPIPPAPPAPPGAPALLPDGPAAPGGVDEPRGPDPRQELVPRRGEGSLVAAERRL